MSTKFDVEDMEVTVNGKTFSVYAAFAWERKAVDYVFCRATGKGADVYAEVPVAVTAHDVSPAPASPEELAQVLAATVEVFACSGKGQRNEEMGKWL